MTKAHKSHLEGEHPKGTLVGIRSRSGAQREVAGIVMDYWPSNVYEGAHYDVLVEGEIVPVEAKYVYGYGSESE